MASALRTNAFRAKDSPGSARETHPRALAKRALENKTQRSADASARRSGLLPKQEPRYTAPIEANSSLAYRACILTSDDFQAEYTRWKDKLAADCAMERKAYLDKYLQSLFDFYPKFTADLKRAGKVSDILTPDDFKDEYTRWLDRDKQRDATPPPEQKNMAIVTPSPVRGGDPVIEGSEAFIARIRQALDLLRPLPSWRYTAKIKRIAADRSEAGWWNSDNDTCFIGPTVAFNRPITYLASFIVHEGAHGLDPNQRRIFLEDYHNTEVFAFTAQLAALRELGGEPRQIAHIERCLANPLGHYTSDHIADIKGRASQRRKSYPGIEQFDYEYFPWLLSRYPEFAADLKRTGKIDSIKNGGDLNRDFNREYAVWLDRRATLSALPVPSRQEATALPRPIVADVTTEVFTHHTLNQAPDRGITAFVPTVILSVIAGVAVSCLWIAAT